MAADPSRKSGDVAGVLLAGGLSRRMGGGDKTLRTLSGRPMLTHVIERMQPQCSTLVINANGDPARFYEYALPVVADTLDGFAGPLAGVLAGMKWAAANVPATRWIATVSTDAPFLPADLVTRFVAAVRSEDGNQGNKIALAKSDGHLHPVIGLWPVALAGDLEEALEAGTRKVLAWTDRHGTVPVEFPFVTAGDYSVDPFFNVNTPEDLAKAESLIEALSATGDRP